MLLLKGGKGGLGNSRFKNASNQAPTYAQKGLPGTSLHLRLELKLIADVGLVGYPNAGKSSLISTLSNAKPEVANYAFTTLTPHLGVVEVDELHSFVMADIPGIIDGASQGKGLGLEPEVANYAFTTLTPHLGVVEVDELHSFVMADIPGIIDGASQGKGLGLEFLKHIERTKFLLFVLDGLNDPSTQYSHLAKELASFSADLSTRPFGIIISKLDVAQDLSSKFAALLAIFAQPIPQDLDISKPILLESSEQSTQSLPHLPHFILGISSVAHTNTKSLTFLLHKALQDI